MNDVIDTTDLRCSRCEQIILYYPGGLLDQENVPVTTALDLMRIAINHGYRCPNRDGSGG